VGSVMRAQTSAPSTPVTVDCGSGQSLNRTLAKLNRFVHGLCEQRGPILRCELDDYRERKSRRHSQRANATICSQQSSQSRSRGNKLGDGFEAQRRIVHANVVELSAIFCDVLRQFSLNWSQAGYFDARHAKKPRNEDFHRGALVFS
jgi:hypothetical protein